jgi:hypothetical protein
VKQRALLPPGRNRACRPWVGYPIADPLHSTRPEPRGSTRGRGGDRQAGSTLTRPVHSSCRSRCRAVRRPALGGLIQAPSGCRIPDRSARPHGLTLVPGSVHPGGRGDADSATVGGSELGGGGTPGSASRGLGHAGVRTWSGASGIGGLSHFEGHHAGEPAVWWFDHVRGGWVDRRRTGEPGGVRPVGGLHQPGDRDTQSGH